MNRKDRRKGQKEQGKSNPVNVLAPNVPINTLLTRQIDKVMDQQRLKASNDTLNLVIGILTIVLKEIQELDVERIEEILKQMMEQMELCGQQLVTIDEMMALAESYGIKTYIDESAMSEIGKKMQRKLKAFEILDTGVTEIEELAEKANIASREASAFRWEYNAKKYGVVDVSKKEQAFRCLDEGLSQHQIINELGISKGAYYNYKSLWRKENNIIETVEDLADVIYGKEVDTVKQTMQVEEETEGVVQSMKEIEETMKKKVLKKR